MVDAYPLLYFLSNSLPCVNVKSIKKVKLAVILYIKAGLIYKDS